MITMHPFLRGPHPRAFAHRGWHIGATEGMENSFSAFRAAVTEGYRYVETDVHATSDGVVVVAHDERLDRTTDSAGAIAELPFSAVSRAKIAGREPVCTLTALLEELPDTFFNIDVKADAAVEPVLEVLRATKAYDRVCLASFSDERLRRLRGSGGEKLLTSMGPRAVFSLLVNSWLPGNPFGGTLAGAAAQIPPHRGLLRLVTKQLLRTARRRGIEVHVWTIDGKPEMTELLDLGVDGLVTDAPDVLRTVLRERGMWH
ncbi:glycerophosphodiester phosphodiesterase family protein [Sciscionella marina]|uniref:glycerophosphodiester phosphodiesterase family protein n=1 Tax=Sciscionella marina TaxID=508770 RepID=UPI00047756F7|nr:glycerophosphodiester phosphodiesterase family protein [Sciscionella marina]